MNAVFIAIMTLLYTMQSFLCRRYSEHYPGKANMASPVFTTFSGGIVALISFTFTGFSFSASPLTILLGLLNAVVLFGYNTCLIKAAQNGPYSILMVFLVAGGIILPSLVSIFAFQEILSAGKIFSILVILIAAYMISRKKEETAFTQKKHVSPCLCRTGIFQRYLRSTVKYPATVNFSRRKRRDGGRHLFRCDADLRLLSAAPLSKKLFFRYGSV